MRLGHGKTRWYHLDCAFVAFRRVCRKSKTIEAPGDLEGFETMSEGDKERVRGLIADHVEERAALGPPAKPVKEEVPEGWACAWCGRTAREAPSRSRGPDGPQTLCGSCSQRYRRGALGPEPEGSLCSRCGAGDIRYLANSDPDYVCGDCELLPPMPRAPRDDRAPQHPRRPPPPPTPAADGAACLWCGADDEGVARFRRHERSAALSLCATCGDRYQRGAAGPTGMDQSGECDAGGGRHVYVASVAQDGRSKCHYGACTEPKIHAGASRLGRRPPASRPGSSPKTQWFHLECYFLSTRAAGRRAIGSLSDVAAGLGQLPAGDRALLGQLVEAYAARAPRRDVASDEPASGGGGPAAAPPEPAEMEVDEALLERLAEMPAPTPAEARAGHWAEDEHAKFLAGLETFGRRWDRVARVVGTRTMSQVRSHAQKYFKRADALRAPAVVTPAATPPRDRPRGRDDDDAPRGAAAGPAARRPGGRTGLYESPHASERKRRRLEDASGLEALAFLASERADVVTTVDGFDVVERAAPRAVAPSRRPRHACCGPDCVFREVARWKPPCDDLDTSSSSSDDDEAPEPTAESVTKRRSYSDGDEAPPKPERPLPAKRSRVPSQKALENVV